MKKVLIILGLIGVIFSAKAFADNEIQGAQRESVFFPPRHSLIMKFRERKESRFTLNQFKFLPHGTAKARLCWTRPLLLLISRLLLLF